MRQLQETVNHLQEFCNTLLQAVTPQVSGNRVILQPNAFATTVTATIVTIFLLQLQKRRRSE